MSARGTLYGWIRRFLIPLEKLFILLAKKKSATIITHCLSCHMINVVRVLCWPWQGTWTLFFFQVSRTKCTHFSIHQFYGLWFSVPTSCRRGVHCHAPTMKYYKCGFCYAINAKLYQKTCLHCTFLWALSARPFRFYFCTLVLCQSTVSINFSKHSFLLFDLKLWSVLYNPVMSFLNKLCGKDECSYCMTKQWSTVWLI